MLEIIRPEGTLHMERIDEIRNLISNQDGAIFTHTGRVHADETYAVASVMLLEDTVDFNIRHIVRINEKYIKDRNLNDSNALILDIGEGRFDHHQKEKVYYKERIYDGGDESIIDTIEKSAVAKLWSYIGPEIVKTIILGYFEELCVIPGIAILDEKLCFKTAREIERSLISKISRTDTTGQKASPNVINEIISRKYDMVACLSRLYDESDDDAKEKVDELFIHDLVPEAYDTLKAYIISTYMHTFDTNRALELHNQSIKEGHKNLVNLEKQNAGKFISASCFPSGYVVSKSNRNDGEWCLHSSDKKLYPLDEEILKRVPGFKKKPIAILAIFDSEKAAEYAVDLLLNN